MLVDMLLAVAERGGDRPALADPQVATDYAKLAGMAAAMRAVVEKSTNCPRVGVMMPSSVAFGATFYGVLWAGRTVVPLNFLLQPAELAGVVKDAGLDTIFTVRLFADALKALPIKTIVFEDLALRPEGGSAGASPSPPAPSVQPDDVAVLLYTSGTAGLPKGVMLTHNNLRSDVDGCIRHAHLKGEHRFLGVLPLFHSFGLTAMLLAPVALGAPVFYLPRFSPAGLLTAAREHRSSVLMLIASMYGAILRGKAGTKEDLASVEYPISGGEALAPAVQDGFLERFGIDILQGYGMTEASPVVSLNRPWDHRRGTVGKVISGVEVAAFDDNGRALPADATGELWVRGPIVMKGYYNRPEDTAAAITLQGWYKTGDMGTVDADGYIRITGRKKEMIIVGGENVYPREIEAALDLHPAVAESAVIGQMDASRGEVVVAFVTLKEGMETTDLALRDHCRQHVAGYKVPRRIIIASDLPRGPTGKILKRKLGELLGGE